MEREGKVILSGNDIRQYLKYGGLDCTPKLRDDQFQQNGLDLILKEVELVRGGVDMNFYLGRTQEYIVMPNDLMGDVALRSTHARNGIFMANTKVDAGFCGTITLEIWAWKEVSIPVGERFVHFILQKLASPSEPYRGKYQGQVDITKAK